MYNTLNLSSDDARTLEMLGFIQSSKGQSNRDVKEAAGTNTSTGGNLTAGQRKALGMGLSAMGVPYAGTILGLGTDLASGNTTGMQTTGANLAASKMLGMIHPALGVLAGQLSVGEMAMAMAKYDASFAESFAAANPKTAAMLGINQPDKEKNQANLDKAIEAGKLLGIGDDTEQGRFDAAMAGLASLNGGNVDTTRTTNDSSVDRTQDPRDNTSSMTDKDI